MRGVDRGDGTGCHPLAWGPRGVAGLPRRREAASSSPPPTGREHTDTDGSTGSVQDVLRGADVFVGVSVGGVLSEDDVAGMAEKAIVFALANPDPGVFRGLLDAGATTVSDDIQLAAARAIADHAGGPDGVDADHIVPDVFDEGLVPALASAVEQGAR